MTGRTVPSRTVYKAANRSLLSWIGRPIRKVAPRRPGPLQVAVAGALSLAAWQVAAPVASADQTTAQPGQASAQSSLFSVGVQSGGTPLLPSAVGAASASYVDTETQASAATLDLGGLGFLLSAIPVCGVTLLPTSRQPQPLTADSAGGSSSRTTAGNVGTGTESVSVTASPESATATTKPITQSLLGGVVDVSGTATSTVRYDPAGGQQSESSTTENLSLGGGLVQIDGMRWTAIRRSGSTPTKSATFSFGQVLINSMGVPVALPTGASASAVVAAINAVVGPLGLRLTLPSSQTDDAAGLTSIGPLQVHFAGSSVERQLITPAAQQIAAFQQVISGQSSNGTDCSQLKTLIGNLSNPAETVDNIVLGIAEGAGGVDLNLGGASTSTQAATAYANPFAGDTPGSGGNPLAESGSGSQALTADAQGLASSGGGDTLLPTESASSATGEGGGTAPSTASVSGPSLGPDAPVSGSGRAVSVRCVTTSPAGGPGCSSGLGELVGAATLGTAAAFITADAAYSRRARRRRPRRSVA